MITLAEMLLARQQEQAARQAEIDWSRVWRALTEIEIVKLYLHTDIDFVLSLTGIYGIDGQPDSKPLQSMAICDAERLLALYAMQNPSITVVNV